MQRRRVIWVLDLHDYTMVLKTCYERNLTPPRCKIEKSNRSCRELLRRTFSDIFCIFQRQQKLRCISVPNFFIRIFGIKCKMLRRTSLLHYTFQTLLPLILLTLPFFSFFPSLFFLFFLNYFLFKSPL